MRAKLLGCGCGSEGVSYWLTARFGDERSGGEGGLYSLAEKGSIKKNWAEERREIVILFA